MSSDQLPETVDIMGHVVKCMEVDGIKYRPKMSDVHRMAFFNFRNDPVHCMSKAAWEWQHDPEWSDLIKYREGWDEDPTFEWTDEYEF